MNGTPRTSELAAWVAGVLRWGTLLAVTVATAGWIASVLSGDSEAPDGSLVERLAAGGADAVAALGLLGLTLLPLAMLTFATIALYRSGERRMALVTLLVTALVVGSLLVAAMLATPS